MNRFFLCGAVSAILGASVFGQTVVVPNAQATLPGNDTSGSLSPPTSARDQTVVNPGQLPAGTISITGFAFRAAPGLGALNFTFNGSIYLSYSASFANNTSSLPLISTTFASNIAGPQTLVFSGSGNMSGAGCSAPGPCAFANNIVFSTPFVFNKANGPLLMDTQGTFGGASGQFDVIDCTNSTCTVNSVFGEPSTATTGTSNLGSSIIQLTYTTVPSTPVPSSILLTLAGLAIVGFFVGTRGVKFG